MSPIFGRLWSSMAKSSVFRTGQRAQRLGRADGSGLKKKGRSVGSVRPLGWKGKTAGWPRSAASGGAEGPVCRLGQEARKGLAGSQVRFAQLGPKSPQGPAGSIGRPFSEYGAKPRTRRKPQCYSEKGNNGNKCPLSPTATRPFGVAKNVLPNLVVATS